MLVESHLFGHQVDAVDQLGAPGGQASGQASGGTRPVHRRYVDAVALLVHLDQALQASGQQANVGVGSPFLWSEHLGGIGKPGPYVAGT